MAEKPEKAPNFRLSDDAGGTIELKALRGAPVVVYFYPKDDTSGCTAEAKDFTCLAGAFAAAGATVIGISPDTVASHAKFKKKHALNVRLAADNDAETAKSYGVWVEKQMYGHKYMGVERATFLIDRTGIITRTWRNVSVPGHAEEVSEAVNCLKS